MNRRTITAVVVLGLATGGCLGALETAKTVADTYQSARGLSHLYYTGKMAKSLKEQEPLFKDYDRVQVRALVKPRKADDAAQVTAALEEALAYAVAEELEAAQLPARVCLGNCRGRVLTVQLKEEGYDQNLFQKLTIGDKIRAKLYFVDAGSGAVVREEQLEAVETYADFVQLVRASVGVKAAKTMQALGRSEEDVVAFVNGADERSRAETRSAKLLEAN